MLNCAEFLEPYIEPAAPHRGARAPAVRRTDPPIIIPGIRADGSQYPVEKIEAHVKGLHHLAVSVFVFDGDELLIQRRAPTKYHCGGQWANTCCTHPNWGEDVEATVARRLGEELGFSVPLEERLTVEYSTDVGNGLWEKERVHIFRADIGKERIRFSLDPDEVSEVRWVTARTLNRDMQANAARYTPWFRIYQNRFPDLHL